MGLITTKVIINLTSKTIPWCEEKGYDIPRKIDKRKRLTVPKGSIIEVNVVDLPESSKVKVKIKCDCCNKIKDISYGDYNRRKKDDDTYYCNSCALNGYKQRITFEQWCLDNLEKEESKEILSRWDYEKNKCNPIDISYGEHGINNKGYWFKCNHNNNHKSELKSINDFTNGQRGSIRCNQCNSFAQWGIDNLGEDFLEKYWDYELNIINPWEIDKFSNNKIYIKCNQKLYHKSYKVSPNNFISNNSRCPYCQNKKVHPKDSLGKYIIDNYGEEFLNKVWSEKNKKSAFEYSPNSHSKVWWKCINSKHDDYLRSVDGSNSYGFRCSECMRERTESMLQEKTRLYLESLGYEILHENKCTLKCINPKTKYILPYDNEITELKLIIEVNGSQHYQETGWDKISNRFFQRRIYDRYKRLYAKSQGYEYLEIPYWTDNENEEWKWLINNKINKILKTCG